MATAQNNEILAALRSVLPDASRQYALHEPLFSGNESDYVKECIDTGWVSSGGKFVDRFEAELAAYTGAAYAIAVVNGTAALHIALRLAGVLPGDEVLVPTLTFIATANAVSYCGATPHFVDSSETDLGLDVAKLARYLTDTTEQAAGQCRNRITGKRIAAIVPMHTFGHPVDLAALLPLAAKYHIPVVEDAAESLGSTYGERHTGTFGLLGILSFNGNKLVTTGGGGAILTDNEDLARHAKHLSTTAKQRHQWAFIHDEIGFNYRMPNLNAALGCAQLEQLPAFLASKRKLASRYRTAFKNIRGVRFIDEPPQACSNFWLNGIALESGGSGSDARDDLLSELHQHGIMARPVWTLMHHLPIYSSCPRMDTQGAEKLEECVINLPSSAFL